MFGSLPSFASIIDTVLSSIPPWVWLASAGASLAIYFANGILSHFPAIGVYARFLRPVFGLITLLSVFMFGASEVQSMWNERVRTAQEDANRKAAQADRLNRDLETERKKKQQVITQYVDVVKEKIVVQREIIDAKCEVPQEAVNILNDAAKNPLGVKK